MLTLNRFGLSNFRVFKEYTEFEFAPITILTGMNNSGKSSLLKALLLVQDNAKRNGLKELAFDGEKHNLGSWEFTKNKYSNNEIIDFTIGFKKQNNRYFLGEYIKEFVYNVSFGNKNIFKQEFPSTIKIKLEENQIIDNNAADFAKEILKLYANEAELEYELTYPYDRLNTIKLCKDGLPHIFANRDIQPWFEQERQSWLNEFIEEILNPAMWEYLHSHFPIPTNEQENSKVKYHYFHKIAFIDFLSNINGIDKEKLNIVISTIKGKSRMGFEVLPSLIYGHTKNEVIIDPYLLDSARIILDFFYDLKEEFIYTDFYSKDVEHSEEKQINVLDSLNYEYLGVVRGKQERAYQHSKKDSALEELLVQFLKTDFKDDHDHKHL